jgi:hypothetical protein
MVPAVAVKVAPKAWESLITVAVTGSDWPASRTCVVLGVMAIRDMPPPAQPAAAMKRGSASSGSVKRNFKDCPERIRFTIISLHAT